MPTSSRNSRRRCWLAILLAVLPAARLRADQPAAPGTVDAVAEIGMTVADLDRAVAFFTDVLAFERVSEDAAAGDDFGRLVGLPSPKARTALLRLGDESIELTEYESPRGRPFPPGSRGNDRWFQHIAIIVSDMDKAWERLVERGVRPASKNGPQRLPDWNENAAGIRAFYVHDPDGHFLEILQFPPDKGDPKWRRPSERLFLGIDHTAIVVADTKASLRFYRDGLGLSVVGGSENYGVEQENLNNVPGAHLRITTLRAAAGPGIELLEYLDPRDGRAYPADAGANDVLHWQTKLIARDAAGMGRRLAEAGCRLASTAASAGSESAPPRGKAVLLRDPDGHAMMLSEPAAPR